MRKLISHYNEFTKYRLDQSTIWEFFMSTYPGTKAFNILVVYLSMTRQYQDWFFVK